jgi:protein disulfide-isomerase
MEDVMKALAVGVLSLVTICAAAAVAADAEWMTDFTAAKKEAAARKVPIVADFSGSDWCGWCKKLDAEVFSKEEFKTYAKESLVLLLLDFPANKKLPESTVKQNEELQKRFGIQGFPTVVLLDADGKELARTGYQPGGAAAYVEHLKKLLAGKPAGK